MNQDFWNFSQVFESRSFNLLGIAVSLSGDDITRNSISFLDYGVGRGVRVGNGVLDGVTVGVGET